LQLIRDKYPWFLKTFKGYPHSIQRADALRYFVLHEFGGIYLVGGGGRPPSPPLFSLAATLAGDFVQAFLTGASASGLHSGSRTQLLQISLL